MTCLKLIVGLGNPGPDYAATRHNAGYWWIERLCQDHNLKLRVDSKFFAQIGIISTISNESCYLMLPNNYMNNSGTSVATFANYYKILPNEILVIHDDLDLECGNAKYKLGGGHGGHNGLRDIITKLHDNKNFYRLRIGIGHPGHKDKVLSYVLGRPSKDEYDKIELLIDKSIANLGQLLKGDWSFVMQELNKR
jgi:peptidyl-tRNA hydrolase, PTH1 family